MKQSKAAKTLATLAHQNQKYGDEPYTYHLNDVVLNVVKYLPHSYELFLDELLSIAWLHDIVEDTWLTINDLQDFVFNDNVVGAVDLLTDSNNPNRTQRKVEWVSKMKIYNITYPPCDDAYFMASYVKLCDRLSNIQAGGKISMYREEHEVFLTAFSADVIVECKPIIDEIERLLKI